MSDFSSKIKEEYENGRDYYKYHGEGLVNLPNMKTNLPEKEFLRWHNENIYRF